MLVSFLPRLRSSLLVVLSSLVLLGLTGCEITYSNKAYEEGIHLYREKMYSDAAGAFRNAIRQEPRHWRSHFYLGVCHEEMGQFQQAFQEYRASLDIMRHTLGGNTEPEFRQQVLDTYAGAIARADDSEVELTRIEQQAKETPNAENWFLLAKVSRLKGDADSAIDAYRRAANFDSQDFNVRKEFGLYLLEPLAQRTEAEYYLRQAYRLNPNDEAVNAALERMGIVPLPAYQSKDTPVNLNTPRVMPLPQANVNPQN